MSDYEPISRRLRSKSAMLTLELMQKNPLQNPLIINIVFSFLDLRSMKQSRLVSKKWNDISIPYMEDMCTVILKAPDKVAEFDKLFRKFEHDSLDISRLFFRSFQLNFNFAIPGDYFPRNLLQFLLHQEPYIEELTLHAVYLPFCSLITPNMAINLTHLNIQYSKIAVLTNLLTSVKNLSFCRCRIDVVSNCKISPQSLCMKEVDIFENGTRLDHFHVNNLLRFKNLKALQLHRFNTIWRGATKLSINLSGNVKVETLSLNNVTIEDFSTSKWKISGKLKLRDVPFEIPNQLEFSEMNFGNETIHLNALPNSIEKLLIHLNEKTKVIGFPRPTLPMLKYLVLRDDPFEEFVDNIGQRRSLTSFENFEHCQNLVTLILLMESKNQTTMQILDTNRIPQSVQTLVLGGKVQIIGHPIGLQKVVMHNGDMDGLLNNLQKLLTNSLGLHCSEDYAIRLITMPNPYRRNVFNNIYSAAQMPDGTLVLNYLQTVIHSKWLAKHVGKSANQHLLKQKKGKAISEKEFWEYLGVDLDSVLR